MPDESMSPGGESESLKTGSGDAGSDELDQDRSSQGGAGKPDQEECENQSMSVDELVDRLKKAESEIEDLNRRYLRALADYDNARKRAQAERDSLRSAVICDFVSHLLPAIDNLERAIESGEQADVQAMVDGLKMVRSQIIDVLSSEGVTCIDAVGTEFDPNKHDAVMQVELDEYGDNIVVEELQRGYEANGRVIRPSMVKVNKARD